MKLPASVRRITLVTGRETSTLFDRNSRDGADGTQIRTVADHYTDTADDCLELYSRHVHYGYSKAGDDPFDREKALRRMSEETVRLLKLPKDEPVRIADLGCGFGESAFLVAKKYHRASILGVNVTARQIAEADKRRRELGHEDRVQFLQADYCRTPFASGSLDGAYAVESSCYASGLDKRDLLEEIFRILKPGARFAIADGFLKKKKIRSKVVDLAYEKLCDAWALETMAHLGSFRRAAREIGFRKVKAREVTRNTIPSALHAPRDTALGFFSFLADPRPTRKNRKRLENMFAQPLQILIGSVPGVMGYFLVRGRKPIDA